VHPAPKAVIFDYGNVLCQPQSAADTQALADILSLPVPQFSAVYWQFRPSYDDGSLPADYWNAVAQAASRELSPAQIAQLTEIDNRSWSHPAPIMPQWAQELRAAGIQTALLSNMPAPVRDYILGCPWLPDFDVRVFSCDFGQSKPAPGIYRYCMQRLGVSPTEALFLDDREANIHAAEALGLPSVLFNDPASVILEITRRFALPAPGSR